MVGFTKREIAVISAVIILTTVFVFVLTWFLVEVLFPPGPRDPLTKATNADIRKDK